MNKLLKISLPVLLILMVVLALGCGAAKQTVTMPAAPPMPSMAPEMPEEAMKGGGEYYSGIRTDSSAAGASTERRIVRIGYLTMEVKDTVQTMEAISAVAKGFDGYVVSSNKQKIEEAIAGWISIRVPVERFDEALASIRNLAVEVPSERTEGRDVTEEYTDLQAQLRNLEATEAQYLELLKKAEKVEDILRVQEALSNVRGQIEHVKGRIQYLERTSDMALIEISLQETKAVGQDGWNAFKTLKSAVDGLITFGRVLASVLIWIVIFIPVWGIITFLVIFFRRRRRKAKAKTS